MSKTLLYRLFGAGKIPDGVVSQVQLEGVLLSEEGIGGSMTFRKFRAPGRYHGWRRTWFSGSLVITRKHLLAFSFSKQIIGVAWDAPEIGALDCTLRGNNTLCISFDASTFNEEWSGNLDICFSTPLAHSFLHSIKTRRTRP